MNYKTVITDQNLLETIQYENNTFPISFFESCFDDYLNGEVNYHWHDEFEFGLILKGEAEYCIHQSHSAREYRVLREGDGIFINSKALHSAKQTVPGSVKFDFVLPASFFFLLSAGTIYQKDILPVAQTALPGLFLTADNELDRELLKSLKEFYRLDEYSAGYELHCIELLCRIWRQLMTRI